MYFIIATVCERWPYFGFLHRVVVERSSVSEKSAAYIFRVTATDSNRYIHLRQQVPPKRQKHYNNLLGVIFQINEYNLHQHHSKAAYFGRFCF